MKQDDRKTKDWILGRGQKQTKRQFLEPISPTWNADFEGSIPGHIRVESTV